MAQHTTAPPGLTRRQWLGRSAAVLVVPVLPRLAQAATIVAVRTWPAAEYTRVTLEMDSDLPARHFLLEDPHRLVVDIHDLTISAAIRELVAKIQPDDPYIAGVRVAQNRPGVVRLVLDLKQPVIPQVFTLRPIGSYKFRLVLDLYPMVAQDPLLALTRALGDQDPLAGVLEGLTRANVAPIPVEPGQQLPEQHRVPAVRVPIVPPLATRPAPPLAARPPPTTPPPTATPPVASQPAVPPMARRDRPILIALDPGHGGEDPGAIGPGGTREKDIVLVIAKRLKTLIDAQPNMRAYLTRDKDFFVPLRVRVQKARRVQADLFVSIHADAWIKPSARGSSVYALSQRGASSSAAQLLAQRENESDLVGGVNLGSHNRQVAEVLLDLSTAAQINDALHVGRRILQSIGRVNQLHKRQVERAGFAVLKAPDIPSILVETAFISNPEEERLLRSPAHQKKLAQAMLTGINDYFESTPGLARRG